MSESPDSPANPPKKRKRSPRPKTPTLQDNCAAALDRIRINTKHLLSLIPLHALARAKDIRNEINTDARSLGHYALVLDAQNAAKPAKTAPPCPTKI